MHIRIIAAALAAATLAAACSPGPGSAEWCKAAIEGKIQPSQAETETHGPACAAAMMQDMMKGLQGQ